MSNGIERVSKGKVEPYIQYLMQAVDGASVTYAGSTGRIVSCCAGMLPVEIFYIKGTDAVGLSIEGVDTGYWHTDEFHDFSVILDCAIAALKGSWKNYISKFFHFREICFQVGDEWLCTRVEGDHIFHYAPVCRKL